MNQALLIIDVQKGIDEVSHWGGNRNNPEAEGNIKVLLHAWRKIGLPVFIIKHCSLSPQSPFYPHQKGNELKDFVTLLESEELIQKETANAFLRTPLIEKLAEKDIQHLYITGFVTNNSIEATARMAGELGFKTTVISDATACFNKTGVDGTVYSAELIHQISLSNLKDEYAAITTTQQVLAVIHKN
jgi:nicotinamidase-related amidase